MPRQINPNLKHLVKCFQSRKKGAVLEGSSRSAKTWSGIDFIVWLCSKIETSATINILKETYNSFKTTLYEDFNRRLPMFGIKSPFAFKQEVKSFKLFGNTINLLGCDSETVLEGVGCDYFFANEALNISKRALDQSEMRCRKFWWYDYNPKYSQHYIYDSVCTRPDVGFLKTTYRDNPYISDNERNKIESYQPVAATKIAMFYGSKDKIDQNRIVAIQKAKAYNTKLNPDGFPIPDLIELERCKQNEKLGTADPYNWSVFGEGERTAPEGLIFPKVNWVNEFPNNIEKIYWGLDFGYSESPSTLVKFGVIGKEIYAQIMFYQPTPSSDILIPLLKKHLPTENYNCWADPSGEYGGRTMITDCRKAGLKVYAANSYPGSIIDGIAILHKYNLNLIECPEWRTEQQGYRKAEAKVGGIKVMTDLPVDDKNHAFDALRISAIMNRL
jgi:phage terminase large subunit